MQNSFWDTVQMFIFRFTSSFFELVATQAFCELRGAGDLPPCRPYATYSIHLNIINRASQERSCALKCRSAVTGKQVQQKTRENASI